MFLLVFWLAESVMNTQLQRPCQTAQPAAHTAINRKLAFFSSCLRCYHGEPHGYSLGQPAPSPAHAQKAAQGEVGQRCGGDEGWRGERGGGVDMVKSVLSITHAVILRNEMPCSRARAATRTLALRETRFGLLRNMGNVFESTAALGLGQAPSCLWSSPGEP